MMHEGPPSDPAVELPLAAILALCISTLMLDGIDVQMVAFAAPLMLREWGLERIALAPALAAALFGMMAGAALGGALGDKWGRRPVILSSTLLFGSLTIWAGAATSIEELIVLRLVGGLGFGAVFPNIFSLVSEVTPLRHRPRMVVLSAIGFPLGGMVGAFATAWAMPIVGWRACFYSAGIVTLGFAGLLVLFLPESPGFLARRRQAAESCDDSIAPGSAGPLPLGSALGIVGSGYLRRTLGLWLLSFSMGYVGYAFLHWIPTLLNMSGLPLRAAISGSFVVNLFTVIGTLIMAWMIMRFGSRASLLVVLLVFAGGALSVGVFVSSAALDAGIRTAGIMVALAAVGFSIGSSASCHFTLSVHIYPLEWRSTGSGISSAIGRLGAVVTAFGGALLLGEAEHDVWAFLTAVLAMLGSAACGVLLIQGHVERRVPEAAPAL